MHAGSGGVGDAGVHVDALCSAEVAVVQSHLDEEYG